VGLPATAPAYLPIGGNDLSFASPPSLDGEPVLTPLRNRCTLCHGPGPGVGRVLTFAMLAPAKSVPPVRLVTSDNIHPVEVARRKMDQESFKSLQLHWQ
jgi:hypothetical protein